MKRKGTLLAILASAVIGYAMLSVAGAAKVAGLCVETGATCNAYYFIRTRETPDTDSIHGYEYGCGFTDRYATGVMRRDGGVWYIGFTGTNHQYDYTQQVTWSGEVDAATLEGTYDVLYTYISEGALSAHGIGDTLSITDCDQPASIAVTGEVMGGYDSTMP